MAVASEQSQSCSSASAMAFLVTTITSAEPFVDLQAAIADSVQLPAETVSGDGTQLTLPIVVSNAGNVLTVETRDFWRKVEVSPKNQDYHYNRNAETYMLVGDALGRGMVALQEKRK